MGFTYVDKYVLQSYQSNEFYLCDFEKSELRVFTMFDEKLGCIYALGYLEGNLVLLNDET